MRGLLFSVCCIALLASPSAAAAADFNPGPGTYTVNTTALTLTGPGGTNITGADENGVATFSFDNVNVGSGVTLVARGTRPFKLAASGDLTLAGTIDGAGTNATDFAAAANAGGPGGGAGANQFNASGSGPGGGRAGSSSNDGASGGGFGGAGARGGPTATGGSAGPAYGNLDATLQGGSGGGGGAATGGGGGGGAVALYGRTVTIASSGTVNVNGGGGAVGAGGASGGGSGGGVQVVGNVVDNRGSITARGGDGGRGGCCGDGGGGGGGRIAFRDTQLLSSGTRTAPGGQSGARSSSNCCTGGTNLSPDAQGAAGVVTNTVGTELIDFNDASAPCCFASTSPLTERYAGRGVHFAGPAPGSGGAILNQSGAFGVTGHSPPSFLAFNTGIPYTGGGSAAGPETITFDKPISTATINTGQGSGGTATLTAFRGTQTVGSSFRTSTAALAPLTVSGEHITRLTLSFTGPSIVFDDLRWNTEPEAGDDSGSVGQDGTLNVDGPGLLANDSDADGDRPTAALGDRSPAHGTVSVRSDGGFTYTPAAGFSGTDSFSYRASDGAGTARDANVSITVTPAPATPAATTTTPPTTTPSVTGKRVPSTTSLKARSLATYTKLLSFAAKTLPANTTVVVTCKTKKAAQQKKGCPYKTKRIKVTKATKSLDLRKPFKTKKLPVGTKVSVTVTAKGYLGKRITYTVRKRKSPLRTVQCLDASGKAGRCA